MEPGERESQRSLLGTNKLLLSTEICFLPEGASDEIDEVHTKDLVVRKWKGMLDLLHNNVCYLSNPKEQGEVGHRWTDCS